MSLTVFEGLQSEIYVPITPIHLHACNKTLKRNGYRIGFGLRCSSQNRQTF